MPGAVKGYLLGYACRQKTPFQWSLQHLVLESGKDKPLAPFSEQPVGFITDGVVYNLLGLLHTGGHKHLAVGVRLYLLPSELLDVALPQPGQAAEKGMPFSILLPHRAFRQAVSVPLGSDAPLWWGCSRCGLRNRWGSL